MNQPTRRRVLAATGTSLAATLAGCSSGDSATATTESAGTTESGLPMHVEVSMESMPQIRYDPVLAHIAVGGTVTWTLDSGSHDTTAYHPETKPPNRIPDGAEPWASPVLSRIGESFEVTFEVPGVYDYLDTEVVCTSHAMVGNMGRIVVGWPDPEGQPALQPPQDELPSLVRDKIRELNPRTRELLTNGPPKGSTTNADQ